MRLDVQPFAPGDIDDAARLLAARHATHRLAQPLLGARHEDVSTARAEIEAVLAVAGASGAIARRDGEAVGYVLGAAKPGPAWGPNVWVESAGHAVQDPEVARDLYGLAAQRWVADGATAHYVLVPAHDPALVDAWSRLAFGQQHTHGIRRAEASAETDSVVRRARQSDIPRLAELGLGMTQHQASSPVFSAYPPPGLEEEIEEWETDFADPAYVTFVADVDGDVLGSAVACALDKSSAHTGPARPDNAGFLGFAAVLPRARGQGLGQRLGAAVIAWSAAEGYASVVTDWRVTNLLSSRTWPKLGFEPAFVRMHRHIGY